MFTGVILTDLSPPASLGREVISDFCRSLVPNGVRGRCRGIARLRGFPQRDLTGQSLPIFEAG